LWSFGQECPILIEQISGTSILHAAVVVHVSCSDEKNYNIINEIIEKPAERKFSMDLGFLYIL
jgi:hypothetical protein